MWVFQVSLYLNNQAIRIGISLASIKKKKWNFLLGKIHQEKNFSIHYQNDFFTKKFQIKISLFFFFVWNASINNFSKSSYILDMKTELWTHSNHKAWYRINYEHFAWVCVHLIFQYIYIYVRDSVLNKKKMKEFAIHT